MIIKTWQVRTEKKIKLKDLVERTGLSLSTIKNIDSGKTSPTMDQMELLANALEVEIEELYEYKRKPT